MNEFRLISYIWLVVAFASAFFAHSIIATSASLIIWAIFCGLGMISDQIKAEEEGGAE